MTTLLTLAVALLRPARYFLIMAGQRKKPELPPSELLFGFVSDHLSDGSARLAVPKLRDDAGASAAEAASVNALRLRKNLLRIRRDVANERYTDLTGMSDDELKSSLLPGK